MFKILKNKRGEGTYIYLCVLVLVMSMLISVLVLYMGLTAQVQIQKRDMQAKLDGYISQCAIEVFDAIKQGAVYDQVIPWDELPSGAIRTLGFTDIGMMRYEYPGGNCSMTRPECTVLRGDGFGVTVKYTAIFPILWNGREYTQLEIPVQITSYYRFK